MIDWNKKNIPNIEYTLIDYAPPTNYKNSQFNLIYAFSVFTHIESFEQENWIKEIHKILESKGVFLFTTHGDLHINNLPVAQQKTIESTGVYTLQFAQKGHRMMATYNNPEHFKKLLSNYFNVLEYYDGKNNISKIGGQDLWIVQKK